MLRSTWIVLAALGSAPVAVATAFAQSPPVLPLQGYLTDSDGVPVDGSHRLTFTVYNAETAGDQLFVDDYTSLALQDGYFTVYLGSRGAPALDLAVFDSTSTAYIEIVIDGTEIISPRTRIGSVAYAAVADRCGDSNTLEGMSATAFAPASHTHPTPTPTIATLENSWVFWGGDYETASYRKDSDGVVHLTGLVKDGTAKVIFTLPEGYRPTAHHLFAALTHDTSAGYIMGRIDVYSDGRVSAEHRGNNWISLDGISFVTAP